MKNEAKENVYIIEKKEILYLPYLAYDRKTRWKLLNIEMFHLSKKLPFIID